MTGRRRRGAVAGSPGGKVLSRPDYATVERAILERNAELLERHGAHHLGVSKKYSKGRRRPETCITFYVKRKPKRDKIAAGRLIPKFLDVGRHAGARRRLVATDVC